MKNNGMMNPPGQPAETVTDAPSSLARNATISTLTARRC
jgi:hypothetical protein